MRLRKESEFSFIKWLHPEGNIKRKDILNSMQSDIRRIGILQMAYSGARRQPDGLLLPAHPNSSRHLIAGRPRLTARDAPPRAQHAATRANASACKSAR